MSTLTHARLAHRYLCNRRSYELFDRCQSFQYSSCSQNPHWNKRNPSMIASITNISLENLTYLQRLNTPQKTHLLQSKFKSVNRLSLSEILKDVQPLILHPNVKFDLSHVMSYQDSKWSYTEPLGSKNISTTLVATLALLGVFKKSINDDIKDEHARLSDTEKFEKMRPIERKIAIGVLWMCDQEYGKANELFHEALHLAQDDKDEEQEEMVLNLIATNYFESGECENAEQLFIDLIKRMLGHDMAPTARPILELSLKLASIYSKTQATHEKALSGFKFVISSLLHDLDDVLSNIDELDIESLNEDQKDALALLGWSYDWFAKHLLNVNDYNAAADMLQRALKISSKVLGQLHDQTLILFNDIGTTLAMNGALEEGRTFIKKAVEGAIKTQSKELASFYVNLGLVNLHLRRPQEAKRYCEYSIELVGKNCDHHNNHEIIELSRNCLNEVERFTQVDNK